MNARTRVALLAASALLCLAADEPAPDAPATPPAADPPAAGAAVETETPADADAKRAEDAKKAEEEREKKIARDVGVATFGGGCFWSMEAVFERVPGVYSVVSGFAGGNVPNPSYEMVGTGQTGHAEVVHIRYNPRVVPYATLLKVFFAAHDPTTLNAQGDDAGTNYRSIILYHSQDQKDDAIALYKALTARHAFRSPIVTQLVPFRGVFPAEPYHQDYFANHPVNYYSQMYIIPKLAKLMRKKILPPLYPPRKRKAHPSRGASKVAKGDQAGPK